jgi:hypothetical protein
MDVEAVPPALREQLGGDATAGLLALLARSHEEERATVIAACTERFERRLVEEIAGVKYVLDESRLPTHWYNLAAGRAGRSRTTLPAALIEQEVTTEREIEIPEPVRDVYRQWRPTPLYRARGWSARSTRPRASTTSTKASPRRAATSRTRPSPRPSTTSRPV